MFLDGRWLELTEKSGGADSNLSRKRDEQIPERERIGLEVECPESLGVPSVFEHELRVFSEKEFDRISVRMSCYI